MFSKSYVLIFLVNYYTNILIIKDVSQNMRLKVWKLNVFVIFLDLLLIFSQMNTLSSAL